MKRIVLGFMCAMGLSASAYAADETELVQPSAKADTFRYGYSVEDTEKASGTETQEKWVSIRSGHLTGGVDADLEKYRLRLNANGGELLGVKDALLSKFQVELGVETHKSPYSVLAMELPVVPGLEMYFGTVNNPGGSQRFLVGPIVYWSQSHSMLLYYPKSNHSTSVVDHSLVLRNRIREFGKWAWLDLDASYKVVDEEDQVAGFDNYGWGASIGVWKMYAKYSQTPYYDGLLAKKTSYEAGIDASF